MIPELLKINSTRNRWRELDTSLIFVCNISPVTPHLQLLHPKLKIYPHLPPPHFLCSKITPKLNILKCTDGQESIICTVDFTRALSNAFGHPKSKHGTAECCLHAWPWNIKAITLVMCHNTSCALRKSNQML